MQPQNRRYPGRTIAWAMLWCGIIQAAVLGVRADQAGADDGPTGEAVATGTIEGNVIYHADPERPWRYGRYYIKDPKSGHLAEAVIGLHGSNLDHPGARQKPATSVIDQKNYRFVPETIAIRAGDRVTFTNSDPEIHSVRTNDGQPFAVNTAPGTEYTHTFPHGGGVRRPIQIGCSYHSNMAAWIYVFDHPYYQVTSTDGRFRLKDIPAGEFQLRMAHPAGRLSWKKEITVKAGQTVELDIHVSPDNLRGTRR
jgi:plastocyanin